MSDNVVEVALRANTSQLIAGMRDAASATGSASQAMRAEIAELGHGAEEASPHVLNLKDTLREYGAHVRSEHRATMLLAQQVSSLGLASRGAASEVTGLIAGFAFGGTVGLMVESVKALAHVFGEIAAEEKKAKEEFQKFADDMKAGTKQLQAQVETMLMTMRGATQAEMLAHNELKPLREEEKKLVEELRVARSNASLAAQRDAADEFDAVTRLTGADAREIELMEKKLEVIRKTIAERKVETGKIGSEEGRAAAKDDQEWRLGLMTQQVQLDRRIYEQKTAELVKSLSDQEKAEIAHLTRQHQAEAEATKKLADLHAHLTDVKVKEEGRVEKLEDAANAKRKKSYEDVARVIEHSFMGAFRSIIDGSKNATDAMLSMVKSLAEAGVAAMLKMVSEAIIADAMKTAADKAASMSTTQGHIAEAAAGAAASQAAIPLAGPFMAMSAAAEMTSFLEGLTAPLLSAAGGFDIPRTLNPITQLHGGEMVLPEKYADVIRGLADGEGGSGGDTFEIHIHGAIDGDSVRRVVMSDAFQRSMAESVRLGRARW